MREVNSLENIDKTIDIICDWIQEEAKTPSHYREDDTMPKTIKALAELVSARARINIIQILLWKLSRKFYRK